MDRWKEIQERLAAIEAEMESAEGDAYDALEKEADGLLAEQRGLKATAERRTAKVAEMRAAFDAGKGAAIEKPVSYAAPAEERTYDASSPEYRSAWLKKAAEKGGLSLGALTDAEERAFTFMTGTAEEVVPTILQNKIIDLVSEETAIFADLTVQGFANAYDVPRLKEIATGDAKVTGEGAANEDEEDDFDFISIVGKEFRKHANITRKMQIQSIDAFENWLVSHIMKRLYFAMNAYVYVRLDDPQWGITEDRRFDVTGPLKDDDVCEALGSLRGGIIKFYANRKTIYTQIAKVKDENGNPMYTDSAKDDPLTSGRLRGTDVRMDNSLADNVIYVGAPGEIEANMFESPNIASDIDVKTRTTVHAGYALFDCILADPRAFAKITIGA